MMVTKEAQPDETQFAATSEYFDAKATRDAPIWSMVELTLKSTFAKPVPRDVLLADAALADMQAVTRMRLSVQKVGAAHWRRVLALAGEQP